MVSRTLNSNPIQPGRHRAGTFTKSFHLEMISDRERVGQCIRAIQTYGDQEKVFVEVGCGTGIFCIEATRHYGTVVAIEKDPEILDIAKMAAKRAGVLPRIRFIEADGFDVSWHDIGMRADVAFVEMLSIWTIEEPQVSMCNHIRSHIVNSDGVIVPRGVRNLLECGYYDFSPFGVLIKSPIPEFVSRLAPRLNTTSQLAQEIDFWRENDLNAAGVVEFVALTDELVNCVRLSSIVDFAPGLNFYTTDTLMPITILPTCNEHEVRNGDRYFVTFEYEYGRPLGEAIFGLRG